ncbi:hypothetical protein BASA81_009074 [Batrachochytrium salamandrivorans]|nr:hypothetical protein BASA81_009074 [Batrachochytrium salamandrivorans]
MSKVGKQQGLPLAAFVSEFHDDQLPNAVPVVVVDAAAAAIASTTKPPPYRPSKLILLLLVTLLAAIGVAIYLIYQYVIEPTLGSSGSSPAANEQTWSPSPPTTWSPTAKGYGIQFVFAPSPNPVPQPISNAFEIARRKWQGILVDPGTRPRPPVNSTLCGHAERTYDGVEQIDGLEIWVSVTAIDGVGGVLGSARPCGMVAQGSFRSVTGEMVFDMDDLQKMYSQGTLVSVITHEMGHVLGLGSFWQATGLVQSPDYIYTGQGGRLGYQEVGGAVGVSPPIELGGGVGTAYTHWDENTFQSELMTGYITSSNTPLSRLTAKALEDLGYTVNVNNADSYVVPAATSNLRSGTSAPSTTTPRHSQQDIDYLNSLPGFPMIFI